MHPSAVAAACLALLAMNGNALAAAGGFRDALPGKPATVLPDAWNVVEGESELLGVRINEVEQEGEVLALRLATRSLAVPVEALARWRLRQPPVRLLRLDGRDYIALEAIPGLRWKVDTSTQTLLIEVPSAAFVRNDFEVVSQVRPAQAVARIGGYVNYDLHWQHDGAPDGAPASNVSGGVFDVGAFNAFGNGRSSALWRHANDASGVTRLDTTWNVDLPQSLASVRVGDAISTAGAWGRSVRFGGVQWATNFAVQPGLVSFPMPAVRGEANVPSIVDLYVNNNHQLQGKVPPGGFDLPDVPVITGAGEIRMVVKDLLGREQVITQRYYVSPTLLRHDLRDFAVEAGTVRENYGLDSFSYGRALVSATDRVGVTDEFTRELHAELLRDQQSLGVGGVWLVERFAVASASAAASRSAAGMGWLVAAGIDHQASDWSAGVQMRLASRDFAQLGAATRFLESQQVQTQRSNLSASFSTSFGGAGVGINYLQQSTWQGDAFRSLSLSLSRSIGIFGYLGVFASRTFGTASGTSIGINLTQTLGDVSASVSQSRTRTRSAEADQPDLSIGQSVVQLQSNLPAGPGLGYQLQAERGSVPRASADATWQAEHAAFSGGVAQANRSTSYRAGMAGALAVMPEGIFTSRRIDGSFAVVQVGDFEGVRVERDNQVVGRTDAKGLAFIGGLRGFESNRISVEGADLPFDAQIDDLHLSVAPGMGSGVSVRFPVKRSRTASMRLVLADGSAVPAGSSVHVDGDKRDYPVGIAGKVFLGGLAMRTKIVVDLDERHCTAEVVIDADADAVPELGTLTCR